METFVALLACVPGKVSQVDEHLDGSSGGDDVDLVDDVAVALAVPRDREVAVHVGAQAVKIHPERRRENTVIFFKLKIGLCDPAFLLPLAMECEFTQPRAPLISQNCTLLRYDMKIRLRDPAFLLPLAAECKFKQPRAHLIAQICTLLF